MFADPRRALRQQAAAFVAQADVVERRHHEAGVAKRAQAGLHQHTERGAELDRVDAQVVGHGVQARHIVRIPQTAVAAHQAQRLVLQRRHHFLALVVKVDVAALDHAAGHAVVRGLASARQVEFADVGAAELERAVLFLDHAPGAEVAHRQAADVVGQVRHHRGAQTLEVVDGRLLAELGAVFAHRAHDFLTVVKGWHLVRIDDDRLDLLRAHHGAHTAARGQS